MALYLVSYDINEKNKDEYDGLWSELRDLGATKILYSEWVVVKPMGSAGDIYNTLTLYIQANDRLLVQEILADAYWDKLLISDDAFRRLLKNARS